MAHDLFGQRQQAVYLGRFRLVRRIGHGAMGVVYEAFDLQAGGGHIAVKVLSRVEGKAIYRLKREFRSLSGVVHPNLVLLHELFIEPAHCFFTMELVEGLPFDSWLQGAGPGAEQARLRSALRQLASGLQAIHAAGKLHCDLKPRNVMVTAAGRLCVLDFGLVGEWGPGSSADATQSGLGGTPAYIAPEQARGVGASPASDWYSVGVMLFEALTGRLPFEGHPLRILKAKQSLEPPDPRAHVASLPDDLSELCRSLLSIDPERRAGLEQVLGVVSRDPPARSEAPIEPSPANLFMGRESELAVLSESLALAQNGVPACVFLPGRSGMGKSALLDRFAEIASREAIVLQGRCHEQESVPYKVFDGVVDALSRHLKQLPRVEVLALLPRHLPAVLQLFPVLGRVPSIAEAVGVQRSNAGGGDLLRQAFAGLHELLLRLRDRGPVVIMVDDLQWGDFDSARMLSAVLGPPEPPAVLFVGAYRSDETDSEFLRHVLDPQLAGGAWQPRVCEVGPLAREAAAKLARALLETANEQVDAIVAEADGVPFFVAELARHCTGQRLAGSPPTFARTLSLEQVILDRAASLPDGSQRLLRVLSVAAEPLEQHVAYDAAGLAPSERAVVVSLRNARLVRTRNASSGDLIETYHDRVRETLVTSMSREETRAIHAALAIAMERHAISDVERLVVHHEGAGDPLRAGRAAVFAAHAAVGKLAFNRAVALFQKALKLLPESEARERVLYRHLGEALANAGQGALSAAAYLTAAEALAPPEATRMLSLATLQCWLSGQTQQAIELTRAVFEAVGISLPEERRLHLSRLWWQRVRVQRHPLVLPERTQPASERTRERLEALFDLGQPLSLAEPSTGLVVAATYLREAFAAGDARHALMALMWETVNTATLGGRRNAKRATRLMEPVRELADRVDSAYARFLLHFTEAVRLFATGRHFQDAASSALTARGFAEECNGTFWERTLATHVHLLCLDLTGNLSEKALRADDTLKDANQRGDQFMAQLAVPHVAHGFLMRDQSDTARALLEGSRRQIGRYYTVFGFQGLFVMMDVLLYAGQAQPAIELFRAEWALVRQSPLYYSEPQRDVAYCYQARAALAAYYQSGHASFRDAFHEAMAWKPTPATGFSAYRNALAASLRAADGQHARAVGMLQASLAELRACQAPLAALYVERLLGRLKNDADAVARVDRQLGAQGVVDVERWSWTHLPHSARW
jgi:eukaryotic-like serine/threonine-protein kinase